jgi:hypothetical protein
MSSTGTIDGYRYRTQGYFDWVDLGYMAIGISGYTRYRTTRTKDRDNQSGVGEKSRANQPAPAQRP